jgi:hypothetical protein
MSRRKRRPGADAETGVSRPGRARPSEPRPSKPGSTEPRSSVPRSRAPRSSEPRPSRRLLVDLGILAAVFAATVGIAELAGAANLGVAIGVGQVTFALVLVALLLRG